jgi:hypothetical protein
VISLELAAVKNRKTVANQITRNRRASRVPSGSPARPIQTATGTKKLHGKRPPSRPPT